MSLSTDPRSQSLRIANIADGQRPGWTWILERIETELPINAVGFAAGKNRSRFARVPGAAGLRRRSTVQKVAKAGAEAPFDLIVSHGPIMTAWTAAHFDKPGRPHHLAYAFNFTDLPEGPRKSIYKKAYQSVDTFVVFTSAEEELYARVFDIPDAKILKAPWGVAPPLEKPAPRQIDRPYVAALGGEARDYETLCKAAALAPEVLFICIARPRNFIGLKPPVNMRVLFNLPPQEAWGIVDNAEIAIVPLRSRETPCGLVTVVGGMHLGKPQIVTGAAGVSDYIRHEETGILTPPKSAWAIANAVNRLLEQPEFATLLGGNAKAYAQSHCSERATFDFLEAYINTHFPGTRESQGMQRVHRE